MATVHKALFTWFVTLIFFILFVLRADDTVDWNWFLIFIPLWIFDAAIMIYIIVNIIIHYRSPHYLHHVDRNEMTMKRKYALLVCCLFKIAFQFLVCLRLEYFSISLYYVLIPLWIMLAAGLGDNFRVLVAKVPYR
ncbi:transmembrane protein 60 [Aplysia californica]|uniref:Transmembrane protein 60 n=1 Tax=Aplysia californica TaxID=6500 RepID=A0ABM0JX20_APLCA|nr:transmembrane protein 60 [Aplysia californica]